MDLKMEVTWDVDDKQPEIKREVFSDEDEFSADEETSSCWGAETHHGDVHDVFEIKSENIKIKVEMDFDTKLEGLNSMFSGVSDGRSSPADKILDITEIKSEDDIDVKVEQSEKLENSQVLQYAVSDSCVKSEIIGSVFERSNSETGDKLRKGDASGNRYSHAGDLSKCVQTHTGKKPLLKYKCDVCSKCFSQKGNLAIHKRIHTGEKPYKCDVCTKCFGSRSDMSKHTRTHTGEKPYKCDQCDKYFSKNSHLSEHKRTHTGERPFQCDVCKKYFRENCHLTRHKRTHTGTKPYKCEICNKCFSQKGNLSVHERIHTGEKPYKCDVCTKSFGSGGDMSKHMRTHTGEKPYKCDVCERYFSTADHLNVHKRTHTGEKPYMCDACGKCFGHGSQLSKHKKTHTKEKPL